MDRIRPKATKPIDEIESIKGQILSEGKCSIDIYLNGNELSSKLRLIIIKNSVKEIADFYRENDSFDFQKEIFPVSLFDISLKYLPNNIQILTPFQYGFLQGSHHFVLFLSILDPTLFTTCTYYGLETPNNLLQELARKSLNGQISNQFDIVKNCLEQKDPNIMFAILEYKDSESRKKERPFTEIFINFLSSTDLVDLFSSILSPEEYEFVKNSINNSDSTPIKVQVDSPSSQEEIDQKQYTKHYSEDMVNKMSPFVEIVHRYDLNLPDQKPKRQTVIEEITESSSSQSSEESEADYFNQLVSTINTKGLK